MRAAAILLCVTLCACGPSRMVGPGAYETATYTLRLERAWTRVPAAADGHLALDQLTREGPELNRVILIGGLPAGRTAFTPGFDAPPRFDPAQGLDGALDFLRGSLELAGYEAIVTSAPAPAAFAGGAGARAALSARRADGLDVSGLVWIGIDSGRLDALIYLAPSTHYFERDRAEVEALAASARR